MPGGESAGLFTADRARLRAVFRDAWRASREGRPVEPLAAQVVAVVAEHPEYQGALAEDAVLDREYLPELGETNPFLHMALHLAVRDQVASDLPTGARASYAALARRLGGAHAAEHAMMECLARSLWEAQRAGRAPDEADYLGCLKARAKGRRRP
jgi:hypothetical protein